jgi:hypothetical protein
MSGEQPHRAAWRRDVLWCLALTVAMELVSIYFRFVLHFQSTRDTRFLRQLTLGIRIHHGFPGLVLVWVALFLRPGFWRCWCLRIGVALIFSDLIHHFLILWPLTGYADFDLLYPP